ncbi:MAG: hypothetical protein RIR50_1311, partial [Pseudomonadota bacterium]
MYLLAANNNYEEQLKIEKDFQMRGIMTQK